MATLSIMPTDIVKESKKAMAEPIRDLSALIQAKYAIARAMAIDQSEDELDGVLDDMDDDQVDLSTRVTSRFMSPWLDGIALGLGTTLAIMVIFIVSGLSGITTPRVGITVLVGSAISLSLVFGALLWKVSKLADLSRVHIGKVRARVRQLLNSVTGVIDGILYDDGSDGGDPLTYVAHDIFGGRLFHIQPDDQLEIINDMIAYVSNHYSEDTYDLKGHFEVRIVELTEVTAEADYGNQEN